MPYKDPEKRREYNRNYQRLRRAGLPPKGSGIEVLHSINPRQANTAGGLLLILSGLISDVLTTKEGDVFIRSRTAGYLISIGLKAVEVAGLEARVEELESKVFGEVKK